MRRAWMLALGAVACGGGGDDSKTGDTGDTGGGRETVALDGAGTACLYGPAGASAPYGSVGETDLVADGATEVQVVLEDCATGCAEDVQATCAAELVGADVVVTATGSFTEPVGESTCVSLCVVVAATCAGPTLPAGSFTLAYGGTTPIGVPSTGPAPCATAP